MDKFNDNWEGNVHKEIPNSIDFVKKELSPLLEEKLKSESVIDHSVDLLDTNVINREIIQDSINNGYDQGQSQGQINTKEKVRVRTLGGLSPFSAPGSSPNNEINTSNYSGMSGGYSNDDNPNVWRTGGYTETMILIGTGVLVLLVFMVSYLMLNYFG